MILEKYPKTGHEALRVRFGLNGVEPEFIFKNIGQDYPDHTILVIVINIAYPSDIILGGHFLNPRILQILNRCLSDIGLHLVHLGEYPSPKRPERIPKFLPLCDCEWLDDSSIYLLIDHKCSSHGELWFWDMQGYYGEFYGEDVAVMIALPQEDNVKLKTILQQQCEQEDIEFTEFPDAEHVPTFSAKEKIINFIMQRLN